MARRTIDGSGIGLYWTDKMQECRYYNTRKHRLGFVEPSVTGAICLIALALTDAFPDWLMLLLLVTAAGTIGFTIGRTRQRGSALVPDAAMQNDKSLLFEQEQDENANESQAAWKNRDYMRDILGELNLMQSSDNLLERYQCFEMLAENILNQMIGPCSISLWCPEENYQNLIECVIRTSNVPDGRVPTALPERNGRHRPCRLPLDSEVIRQSLKSGKSYLAENPGAIKAAYSRPVGISLRCDACIPLYRKYGQPLLINVERTEGCTMKWSGGDRPGNEDFNTAVNMINLFWKQLQAANQREWIAEHDQTSGVLRDEVFLRQGQEWADRLAGKDELFAVVVITVRGFRGMFAGQSRQWRNLAGIIGRCLKKLLIEKSGELLLGKMADDVFALILPWKDKFLAQAAMQAIIGRLGEELVREGQDLMEQEVMAVDLQWAVADHRQYEGNIERLLNQIYRRLFSRNQPDQRQSYRIVLEEASSEVV